MKTDDVGNGNGRGGGEEDGGEGAMGGVGAGTISARFEIRCKGTAFARESLLENPTKYDNKKKSPFSGSPKIFDFGVSFGRFRGSCILSHFAADFLAQSRTFAPNFKAH